MQKVDSLLRLPEIAGCFLILIGVSATSLIAGDCANPPPGYDCDAGKYCTQTGAWTHAVCPSECYYVDKVCEDSVDLGTCAEDTCVTGEETDECWRKNKPCIWRIVLNCVDMTPSNCANHNECHPAAQNPCAASSQNFPICSNEPA